MRIRVLGAFGGESLECRVTSLMLNDELALDAGSLSRALAVEEQQAIRAVVLSHSHWDHTNSLPFFIENIYATAEAPIEVYASRETIASIRAHLFNDSTWPDFTRLPTDLLPAVRFRELVAGEEVEIRGLRLTPIPVNHPVPTFGFLIRGERQAILWSSDTGPTSKLWEVANQTPDLAAVCIDTSFDNALQAVADISGHLTPRTLALELAKLERSVPVLLHHLKPPSVARIREEVRRLERAEIDYLEQGKVYQFS